MDSLKRLPPFIAVSDKWLAEPSLLPHEPLPVDAPAACNFEQEQRK